MPTFASFFSVPELGTLKLRLPLGAWLRVARERQALARLDAQRLADLGIDETSAAIEAARPFWDLPAARR